ncbi:Aldo/keto reductase [Meredithblackwellia eburnea MCA 4105]
MPAYPYAALNDGRSVPALGFGTGTALYGQSAKDSVLAALKAGFEHLDAAAVYNNEESVGEALVEFEATGGSRDDLWITSKAPMGGNVDYKAEVKKSLAKLKTSYLDLYLIHSPEGITDLKAAWKAMEEIKAEGLARSIGVSNFALRHLNTILESATVIPAVNQIEFNPYLYKTTQPLLELQQKHGIVLEAYGPLTPLRSAGPLDKVLPVLAHSLKITTGQLLLNWARRKGAVIITTTNKPERAAEVLAVGALPALTPEVIAQIESAAEPHHTRTFFPHMDEK